MQRRHALCGWVLASITPSLACDGPLSAMDPAGRDASEMFAIFLWMAGGAAAIWLFVMALALILGTRSARRQPHDASRQSAVLIVGGGVIFPVIVLTSLAFAALPALPRTLALPDDQSLRIEVTGRQWWWRVRYVTPGADPVELANEIRLPVGRRVTLRLASDDVIHSFWVPSLAGKLDMIPGRVNHLALEPQRTGTFRGACAEFCGTSHARMQLVVVVTEPGEFTRWLGEQADRAVPAMPGEPSVGQTAFAQSGCIACHAIRGTDAAGVLGPDLTHVGSRTMIAAGLLPMSVANLREWIRHAERLKPGVHMPAFDHLAPETSSAIAAYLAGLR
jgi:cytochrome c oxidase subunit 2